MATIPHVYGNGSNKSNDSFTCLWKSNEKMIVGYETLKKNVVSFTRSWKDIGKCISSTPLWKVMQKGVTTLHFYKKWKMVARLSVH